MENRLVGLITSWDVTFRYGKIAKAAGFLPSKKSIKNLSVTQALKSCGINFCSLVQLNISLKTGTSTRRFHLTHDFHGGGLQLRILENAGSFPWDFMGFHGFCGWKSGYKSLRLVVTPLPKDACSSIREYLT